MGRIKSLMVKRAAQQLLEGENSFTSKFDDNKKILSNNMPSKPIRNKIAGYLARIVRRQNEKDIIAAERAAKKAAQLEAEAKSNKFERPQYLQN